MEPLKKPFINSYSQERPLSFKCPSVGLSAGIYFLIRYAACQPSCIYSLSCFGLLVNGCMYEWVPALSEGCRFARQNVWVNRYITDVPFRVHISLYLSLAINILYAVIKFISGVHYRSLWLVSIAVYYGLLALMRFLLLWRESPQSIEKIEGLRFAGIVSAGSYCC